MFENGDIMGYFNYLYYYDWTYIAFMIPCILITLFCQVKVNSAYSKYSKIPNSRNMTGEQAARQVLYNNGVTGVTIERVSGKMTDHFDPRTNVIRLSDGVYDSATVAAVGIACHEAGHAVQHAQGYFPNKLRSAILPLARLGSTLSWILIAVGLLIPNFGNFVLDLGIIFFAMSMLFTLVTLPVEFNASSRALKCIKETNMLSAEEYPGARSVLQAAAMTYVAAALTSILQFLRLLLIVNNRRD